jgi:hypothetical protein
MPILRAMARAIAALTVALALLAPPAAEARYSIGIGDQHADTFSHPLFRQLGVRYVRLVAPWDALSNSFDTATTDAWLGAARAAGAQPLISFNHSRVKPRKLPSVRAYKKAFKAFRARYPWVKTYSPWNEVNHKSQPTFHRPQWAARYYNVVRASCRGCTIVAADVLDQAGMTSYLKGFRRFAKGSPRLWGLHNYSDTNRFRSRGTKELLRAVRGNVWLTETGGIVKFAHTLPYNEKRAARATKFMFKLAASNRRIKRLYIYSWKGETRGARFDAGLVGPDGRPRPAYNVVAKKLKR